MASLYLTSCFLPSTNLHSPMAFVRGEVFDFNQKAVLQRQKVAVGEEPRHEFELLADADGLLDFETVFFCKTAEALFGPERLVVDV